MDAAPYYKDWTFWSFAVAALAVLLSQLPPLAQLFRRGKVEMEIYGKLCVNHMMGYANTSVILALWNSGGRPVRINRIDMRIYRSGQLLKTLVCHQYFLTRTGNEPVAFIPFNLERGAEWTHAVVFVEPLSWEDEKRAGRMRADLKRNIEEKIYERNRTVPEAERTIVVADDEFILPVLETFRRNFMWGHGEYEFDVQVVFDRQRSITSKRARFTLYESDSAILSEYAERYRFGFGPALDDSEQKGVFQPFTPISQ